MTKASNYTDDQRARYNAKRRRKRQQRSAGDSHAFKHRAAVRQAKYRAAKNAKETAPQRETRLAACAERARDERAARSDAQRADQKVRDRKRNQRMATLRKNAARILRCRARMRVLPQQQRITYRSRA